MEIMAKFLIHTIRGNNWIKMSLTHRSQTLFLKNTFDIPEGFEIFFEAIKSNMNKY